MRNPSVKAALWTFVVIAGLASFFIIIALAPMWVGLCLVTLMLVGSVIGVWGAFRDYFKLKDEATHDHR